MAKKHLRVPKKTTSLNQKILGEDYFKNTTLIEEENLQLSKEDKYNIINYLSQDLLVPNMLGEIAVNQTHYLGTVDLFMAASFEKEHRKEILNKELILKLKNFTNFLDIGVGKGEITKFIGKHFSNITLVDNSLESLSNLPNIIGPNNSTVHKVCGDILTVDVSQIKYDLILMSHTLYYIVDNSRDFLLEKLYNMLNENGVVAFVYNDGLGREKMVKHFQGRQEDFYHFILNSMYEHKNSYALLSTEIMEGSKEPMLHVSNMILYDANAKANISAVSNYLDGICDEDFCQINMHQNFIFIGRDSDETLSHSE
ncbi:MAG: class I SAM-dependent methyltransferase [Rickettsiales bacterium]